MKIYLSKNKRAFGSHCYPLQSNKRIIKMTQGGVRKGERKREREREEIKREIGCFRHDI